MVLRFNPGCNVKGTIAVRFSVLLPPPQVLRNEHYKARLMALSLLSPFLYLKTVASLHATLYNSGQRNAPCPGACTQNFQTQVRWSRGSEAWPVDRTVRGGVL